jgi:predicted extracellular nuclease
VLLSFTVLCACGGNGGVNNNSSPPPPGPTVVTSIYDIQGTGTASPMLGQTVTVDGIVTGDFQDGDGDASQDLRGFYIQNTPDADLASSDGVFVFDGDNPARDVSSGDLVRVAGTVQEHFGETQIAASGVTVIGAGTIQPVDIELPIATTITNSDGLLVADLERFEGMLVRFPQTLTVGQTRGLERYGDVMLNAGGRQFAYTERNAPDVAGNIAHLESIAANRFVLDDGLWISNAAPIRHLNAGTTSGYSIRVGDEIAGLTGVLRYSRGSGSSGTETFRLIPTIDPLFESRNPRPTAPVVTGDLRITSFNLNNFFSTIDDGRDICGPANKLTCRGADSATELQRQLSRITVALQMIDADIVGLVELENNASASLQALVDALNTAMGAATYAYVDSGTIGTDAIKVGLLYKPATVRPAGEFAILDSSVDPRFLDRRSRPVLAQTFEQTSNSAVLTVAVNHLKSKGSSCAKNGDPDLGDGQQNCAATRTAATMAMIDWLATDPTASGDSDFLVIGDPNAHTFDNAITVFRNAGYSDLAEVHLGTDSYSFEFDGQSGALDHALASSTLTPQVSDVIEWHINADEPRVLNYDLEFNRDPDLFDSSVPYRSSDHDPLIIGLDLH